MSMRTPRRALALLLLGAWAAVIGAGLAPAAGGPCRCTGHVCCGTGEGATVCPLRRAGVRCGMPQSTAAGSSLRTGCSCGHGGPPGTAAREEPALAPAVASLPAETVATAARPRLDGTPLDLVRRPESPPPRFSFAVV